MCFPATGRRTNSRRACIIRRNASLRERSDNAAGRRHDAISLLIWRPASVCRRSIPFASMPRAAANLVWHKSARAGPDRPPHTLIRFCEGQTPAICRSNSRSNTNPLLISRLPLPSASACPTHSSCWPGSTTTRGRRVSRDIDTGRVAFCGTENISTPNLSYAAQYLACALTCERFTSALADNSCITWGRYGSLLRKGGPCQISANSVFVSGSCLRYCCRSFSGC
jgi:hypothetical protein